MLTVHHLSKSFGVESILNEVSFNLNRGQRLGLVGPNGCGKTTLLRILAGADAADSGAIQFTPPDLRVGYLPQGLVAAADDTLGSFLALADPGALTAEVERLASDLAADPHRADLHHDYDAALVRLVTASEHAKRLPQVLAALGLGGFPLETPVSSLSGGQKTRLALASVLLSDPQLLLLDEPTNHLDFEMLEWLENWLGKFSGGVLFVSHDRAFLDQVVTGILELDPQTHKARQYAGDYTEYLEQKLAEREKQWQMYSNQQEEIVQLQAAARHLRGLAKFKRGGKADTGDKFAKGFFANRGAGTVGRAKHIEQRLEKLLTDEKIEKPKAGWQMKLEFGGVPASGREVLTLEKLAVGYGDQVLLRDLDQQICYGSRAALIGPNGAGKTTLLRTIAGQLPPLAGRARLGANVRVGYMSQEQETLEPALHALHTIQSLAPFSETEARTFLHQFLFTGDDVFTPVGKLSFGERARLALAGLVAQGCNFLLLDEPINHLDIPSRARFEQALAGFEGTVLAVVHDRYFIEGFATEIWEVAGERIERHERESAIP